MHRDEKTYGLGGNGGYGFKLPRIFIKPVTTDKNDYQFSHFFSLRIFSLPPGFPRLSLYNPEL